MLSHLTKSILHWKLKVVMVPILSSIVALDVVIMANHDAASDDKFDIMTTLGVQCP